MAHPNAVQVKLEDIEKIDKSDLKQKKLDSLENSYDSFEDQLNSQFNPIALDKHTTPYKILDGRHRVFLARKKGYTSVPAVWV
jgi:ParB-like chromosome segregation protein Spo0J